MKTFSSILLSPKKERSPTWLVLCKSNWIIRFFHHPKETTVELLLFSSIYKLTVLFFSLSWTKCIWNDFIFIRMYYSFEELERSKKRQRNIHSVTPQIGVMTRAKSGAIQQPGASSMFPTSTWAVFGCLSRFISRELNPKDSNQNLNQGSHGIPGSNIACYFPFPGPLKLLCIHYCITFSKGLLMIHIHIFWHNVYAGLLHIHLFLCQSLFHSTDDACENLVLFPFVCLRL